VQHLARRSRPLGVVNEILRELVVNSAVHFLLAACHKIFDKLRQLASHDHGIVFVYLDIVDVMRHGSNMVLERTFSLFCRYNVNRIACKMIVGVSQNH
jgi:hypothetical protein